MASINQMQKLQNSSKQIIDQPEPDTLIKEVNWSMKESHYVYFRRYPRSLRRSQMWIFIEGKKFSLEKDHSKKMTRLRSRSAKKLTRVHLDYLMQVLPKNFQSAILKISVQMVKVILNIIPLCNQQCCQTQTFLRFNIIIFDRRLLLKSWPWWNTLELFRNLKKNLLQIGRASCRERVSSPV